MKIVGLMGVKKNSSRLKNKGWRYFFGKPLFVHNLEKGLHLFDEFYVSSDYDAVLKIAEQMGALPIVRNSEDKNLIDGPNITYYQHAYQFMGEPDVIVAIQANSPSLEPETIETVIQLMKEGNQEVKTCHGDKSDYGSVWAMTKERLFNYKNPYHAKPDVWIRCDSIDIHTISDLRDALRKM